MVFYCRCRFSFFCGTQCARLDWQNGSSEERVVGYPIPCSLWQFNFFITYNLHRDDMGVWVVVLFDTLFQNLREHAYVSYRFVRFVFFVLKNQEISREIGGKHWCDFEWAWGAFQKSQAWYAHKPKGSIFYESCIEMNERLSIAVYTTVNHGTHERSVQKLVLKLHRNEKYV